MSIAHSLNHSFFFIAPVLITPFIIPDLATSKTIIGLIGTTGSLIYGLGSLLAGSLADRTNQIHLIMISTALAGISVVTFLFAQNILTYTAAFISMCIWTGLYHPAANTLISKLYSGTTGEAMGIHGAGGTIGIVFTPFISITVAFTLGWRTSFAIFGISAIITSILFTRSKTNHTEPGTKIKLQEILRIRGLWLLLTFNFAIGLYMKSVELFFPAYLTLGPLRLLGQGTAELWAGILTSLMLLIGAAGQWLGGHLTDRHGAKKILTATSLAIVIGFVFLIATPPTLWYLAVAAFMILYGLAFYGHQPAFNALAGFMTPTDRRGMVYGLLFFTSFGIGAISQTITGYISDRTGITTAFSVLSLFAAAAFIASLFITDIRENPKGKQS